MAALIFCAILRLQDAFDVDRVAVLPDVASVQQTPVDATRCGLLYAAGHAATVGPLGIAFIILKRSVPPAKQYRFNIPKNGGVNGR